MGHKDFKGTYFAPEIITEVLVWSIPYMKKFIYEIFEDI
jgi:hypothetical protein